MQKYAKSMDFIPKSTLGQKWSFLAKMGQMGRVKTLGFCQKRKLGLLVSDGSSRREHSVQHARREENARMCSSELSGSSRRDEPG